MSDYEESPLCRREKSTRLRRVFMESSHSSLDTTPVTPGNGSLLANSFLSEDSPDNRPVRDVPDADTSPDAYMESPQYPMAKSVPKRNVRDASSKAMPRHDTSDEEFHSAPEPEDFLSEDNKSPSPVPVPSSKKTAKGKLLADATNLTNSNKRVTKKIPVPVKTVKKESGKEKKSSESRSRKDTRRRRRFTDSSDSNLDEVENVVPVPIAKQEPQSPVLNDSFSAYSAFDTQPDEEANVPATKEEEPDFFMERDDSFVTKSRGRSRSNSRSRSQSRGGGKMREEYEHAEQPSHRRIKQEYESEEESENYGHTVSYKQSPTVPQYETSPQYSATKEWKGSGRGQRMLFDDEGESEEDKESVKQRGEEEEKKVRLSDPFSLDDCESDEREKKIGDLSHSHENRMILEDLYPEYTTSRRRAVVESSSEDSEGEEKAQEDEEMEEEEEEDEDNEVNEKEESEREEESEEDGEREEEDEESEREEEGELELDMKKVKMEEDDYEEEIPNDNDYEEQESEEEAEQKQRRVKKEPISPVIVEQEKQNPSSPKVSKNKGWSTRRRRRFTDSDDEKEEEEGPASSQVVAVENSPERKSTSRGRRVKEERLPSPPPRDTKSPLNDSDDSFEKYLESLRAPTNSESEEEEEDTQTTSKGRSRSSRKNDSFVVPDECVSESDSGSEYSDDEESVYGEEGGSEDDYSDTSEESEKDKERDTKRMTRTVMEKRVEGGSLADAFRLSFASPSVKKKAIDPSEHFLMSLSTKYDKERHADAAKYVEKGIKRADVRSRLCARLFEIFNNTCFKEKLPSDMEIVWRPRLRKTAGRCVSKWKGLQRCSLIEMSPKVCTTPERLRDTLIHELCHAAVWIVDGVIKEGHGPRWKQWAARCNSRFKELPFIGRCHNYEIEAKYIYKCSGGCGQEVKRHSKSLDISRKVCGRCRGTFELLVISRGVRKPVATQSTQSSNGKTRFADFVKMHYSIEKMPGRTHGEVMRILSAKYKATVTSSETEKTLSSDVIVTSPPDGSVTTDDVMEDEVESGDEKSDDRVEEGEGSDNEREDRDNGEEEEADNEREQEEDAFERTMELAELEISTLSILE